MLTKLQIFYWAIRSFSELAKLQNKLVKKKMASCEFKNNIMAHQEIVSEINKLIVEVGDGN